MPVSFPVFDCTSYVDANMPSKYDMEKIAWVLDVSKKNSIGFIKPGTEEHEKLLGR